MVGDNVFVGRWRDCVTPEDFVGYEGTLGAPYDCSSTDAPCARIVHVGAAYRRDDSRGLERDDIAARRILMCRGGACMIAVVV